MIDPKRLETAHKNLKLAESLLNESLRQAIGTRTVMGAMLVRLAERQKRNPESTTLADALLKLSRIQRQNYETEVHLIQTAVQTAQSIFERATEEELEDLVLPD